MGMWDATASGPDSSEDSRYRFDPAKFPRRIDLELSEEAFRRLAALSACSGRSISEVAAELFGRLLGDTIPEA